MYDDVAMSVVGLCEEVLPIPFLAAIPTATAAWLRRYWKITCRWAILCGLDKLLLAGDARPETVMATRAH